MINGWFWVAIVLGVIARVFGGQVISVTAGLAVGVVGLEVVKYLLWRLG